MFEYLADHCMEWLVIPFVTALLVLVVEYFIIQPIREKGREKGLKIKPSLEVFPVIVPVDYVQEHGHAATLRLKLRLINLTSPPRAIHLADSSITIWPRLLPFLRRKYSLGTPLIGEDPESATPTVGMIAPETLGVSGSPIIKYIRGSPFRGSFRARIQLVDEAGVKHSTMLQIPREMASQAPTLLTWDDYKSIFE